MEGMRVKYGRGRPRSRPGEVAGDSAYDTRDVRAYLRRRGIKANIPVNIRNRRRPRHGRPYRLDLEAYKRMRSSVERFFAWLTNGFRRLAIRWERLASTFTGFIQLACIIIYLRVFR
jgi:transposase